MRTYRYEAIPTTQLSATDLRHIAAECDADRVVTEAYAVYVFEDDKPMPNSANALYLPGEGRLGIAWGADASWADVDDLESGIEMWLNDPDEWESRN